MGVLLPYRAGADELAAWVGARARGRAGVDPEAGAGAAKAAEGAATTAAALGLADAAGELTAPGRRFALAAGEERHAMLREAVLSFPPYRELLDAVAERGDRATEAQWIETWWATRGYGGSASNRREGAAAFGRLVDAAGLGRYVPGRRGHPTRLEWEAAPRPALSVSAAGDVATGSALPANAIRGVDPEARSVPRAAPAPGMPAGSEPGPPPEERGPEAVNRVVLPLGEGRTARLEVPARLPRAEKRRLLDLLDLLIAEA